LREIQKSREFAHSGSDLFVRAIQDRQLACAAIRMSQKPIAELRHAERGDSSAHQPGPTPKPSVPVLFREILYQEVVPRKLNRHNLRAPAQSTTAKTDNNSSGLRCSQFLLKLVNGLP